MVDCQLKMFGIVAALSKYGTGCAIREEQCGFRHCRECMHKVFAERQVCEQYLSNGKDVFWVYMDLEKACDTVDRPGMWQMLSVMKALESSAGF